MPYIKKISPKKFIKYYAPIEQKTIETLISSSSSITSTSKLTIYLIEKPKILNPKNNETDFLGQIQSSNFKPTDYFEGKHEKSDWEIATDYYFNNIVESSYDDTVNLTTYNPTSLEPGKTYYVRVRYISDNHKSEWSDPVKFTTKSAYIFPPQVSISSDTKPGSLYPKFVLTPFKQVGYDSKWAKTEWQIATDSEFKNIIYEKSITDPALSTTLKIEEDILSPKSTYYIRARYQDNKGHYSNYSKPLEYNTDTYILDDVLNKYIPDTVNELSSYTVKVTHDNNKSFDTTKYKLNVNVDIGDVKINGFEFTYNLPEVEKDTTSQITVYVTDKSGNIVSNTLTKTILIKNIKLTSDTAVVVNDFTSASEYNDGWDI